MIAATGAPVTGILLPRAALAQAPNGQTVVFSHKEPEVFVPRPVRVGALRQRRPCWSRAASRPARRSSSQNAPLLNQVR